MPARTEACRLSPPGRTVTGLVGWSDATSCSAFSRRRLSRPPSVSLARLFVAARSRCAAPVLAERLGEDHAAGRGLNHRRDDRGDGLVDEPASVLHNDHGAVVEAAHALTWLLALARHGDHDLLAWNRHWTHRLRELVQV